MQGESPCLTDESYPAHRLATVVPVTNRSCREKSCFCERCTLGFVFRCISARQPANRSRCKVREPQTDSPNGGCSSRPEWVLERYARHSTWREHRQRSSWIEASVDAGRRGSAAA